MAINETSDGQNSIAITATATGEGSIGMHSKGDAVGIRGDGKTWHGVVGFSEGGFGVYGEGLNGGSGVVGKSTGWAEAPLPAGLIDDLWDAFDVGIERTLLDDPLFGERFGQSLLKYVFGEVYKLKPQGWLVLTVRWGLFFFVLAALNEVVWRFFPDQWVNFKVWGIMPITVLFSVLQLPVLSKYAPDPEPETAA